MSRVQISSSLSKLRHMEFSKALYIILILHMEETKAQKRLGQG